MRTEQWMASAEASWGVKYNLRAYQNPRELLLYFCDVKDQCWISRRAMLLVGAKEIPVQSAAYVLFVAPMKPGDVVVSSCGSDRCCCPDHLRLRTSSEGAATVLASSPSPTPDGTD